MENLQIFKNEEFGEIRTVTVNNEPWFVGKDIAEVLGYERTTKAIQDRVDEDDRTMLDGKTQSQFGLELGQRGGWLINESGLYSLILSSKLPTAKKFKHWVTAEVLPTIRKTGGYVSNDDMFINTYLPFADDQTKLLFKSTLETVKALNKQIEADKPKVLFANAVETAQNSILVGDLAKLINQNGVNIGQKRLFDWMRENGYLIKNGTSKNMPTQKAMDLKLFEIKERTVNNPDGLVRITKTTKVTGKGQSYFINKFLSGRKEVKQ